ncbi:MAG: helicase-related protein, partial [Gammaproteobacteria bacterium]
SRDISEILASLPARRQTMLYSATYSTEVRALAATLLHHPLEIDATPRNTTVTGVRQSLVPVDKRRKLELFCHLLRKRRWQRLMVFANSRKRVEEVLASLRHSGVPSEAIHGEIPQHARLAALRRFNAGETRVLVATDVAARGLDISALPLVFNLDLPVSAEGYVHRIGRTARAGEVGEAISLVCADEAEQLAAIETLIGKQLPRREVEGFEPKHRVPATGPNKPPPARSVGKAAAPGSRAPRKAATHRGRAGSQR